jgi:hypothetical protein
MRVSFLLISFLFSLSCFSQSSDFIILKKKGRTTKSYYTGTQIEFVTNAGAYRNALITAVRNDSVYLQEFVIRQLPTTLGTYITDTAGSFRYIYHYKDIAAMGAPAKGKFNWRGSGSSLMGGSVLLILGSGVVYLADRDNFSPALMGAAAGLGILGYFMNKGGGKGIVIGKKGYTLEYMDLTP